MINGFGSGYGHGYGCGEGYGDGDGDGYGYGCGEGYGYGNSLGDGDGDGDGEFGIKIAKIKQFNVILLAPFRYIKIGCKTHPIVYWCKNWRKIAENEFGNGTISEADVKQILDTATKLLQLGQGNNECPDSCQD